MTHNNDTDDTNSDDSFEIPDDWGPVEIDRALGDIGESLTGDQIGTITMQGTRGFHVFADPTDGPATAFDKAMHVAIYEALGDMNISIDHRTVEQKQGEVTPETIVDEFIRQMNSEGPGFLIEAIEDRLIEQLEHYEAIADALEGADANAEAEADGDAR